MSSDNNTPGNENAHAESQQRQQVVVDDSKSVSAYANFCRVTGTPEELIIDFGLNPQPAGPSIGPIQVNQRVVMSFYTAKRVLLALSATLQRHEDTFGSLEIDVQKRVKKTS
ncbi:MAG TPA: DUF3467 domain-containing protein [Planctomycetaceae bacterium]|nr:DUF3467 domain-containing protein [Planctomycetaceae bacterium]